MKSNWLNREILGDLSRMILILLCLIFVEGIVTQVNDNLLAEEQLELLDSETSEEEGQEESEEIEGVLHYSNVPILGSIQIGSEFVYYDCPCQISSSEDIGPPPKLA